MGACSRGSQQQPLLGVHGQGLAGGDAEKFRLEQSGVVQEAAVAGVGLALGGRGGGVEGVGVPAAGGGGLADGGVAAAQQVPQVVRSADPAGQSQAHADDRDRVAGNRGGGQEWCCGFVPGKELHVHILGQGGGAGVVEDDGGGQRNPGGGGEPVAQFHGGQGVEPDVAEGAGGGETVARSEERRV